jgi:hypothetical protein
MTGFYSKKIKDVRERADNLFGTILNLPRHGNGILRMSSEGSGGGARVSKSVTHFVTQNPETTPNDPVLITPGH